MKDPKKFIRIMCLILVAVMVLGLIPAIAFAAGGQQTVLLTNTAGWSTPYIYFWSDSNTGMTSWPGQPMTLLEGNIYYHAIPADATYVIFSDGNGTQTSDLTIPQGMNHFNYGTGSWSVYEGGDFCVHSYDGGTVTTAPTCISTGVRTYTCTKCGDIRTEDVAQTSQPLLLVREQHRHGPVARRPHDPLRRQHLDRHRTCRGPVRDLQQRRRPADR